MTIHTFFKKLMRTLQDILWNTLKYSIIFMNWVFQAWSVAWETIFYVLKHLLSILLLSRQVWSIFAFITIVWMVIAGPSLYDSIQSIDEWQLIACEFSEAEVYITMPKSAAPGDQRLFEISTKNKSEDVIYNAQVSITSSTGILLFDETSIVTIGNVLENEAVTRNLPFRIASLPSFEEIPLIISYSSDTEGKQPGTEYCQKDSIIKYSKWRKYVVIIEKIPNLYDAGAKYFGYLGTIFTGMLAIRGKFSQVIKAIIKALKFSQNPPSIE